MTTKTKERPILLTAAMVRAILDGQKTQTRRIAKEFCGLQGMDKLLAQFPNQEGCRYGKPGDRLWVRETWGLTVEDTVCYRADEPSSIVTRWRPSIFMPRWGSRILLEITAVRVERLQSISEADARAEGIADGGCLNCGESEPCGCGDPQPDARDAFAWLWQSIHGSESWHVNPPVWVVEFRRVQP